MMRTSPLLEIGTVEPLGPVAVTGAGAAFAVAAVPDGSGVIHATSTSSSLAAPDGMRERGHHDLPVTRSNPHEMWPRSF